MRISHPYGTLCARRNGGTVNSGPKRPTSRTRDGESDFSSASIQQLVCDTGQFLTARPSPARVCQYLVFHQSWPAKPWSAALGRCSDDGVLHLVGTFGVGRELVDAYESMPLYEGAPIVEAVTTGKPAVYVGDAELAERYPDVAEDLRTDRGFNDQLTLITVPLLSYAGPIGSLGIFFTGTDHPVDPLVASMEQIAALLSVYLEVTPETLPASTTARVPPFALVLPDADVSGLPVPLTKRQLQVLGFMAQRMSNREIADALDYSESTVRMEATAIYRALGVNGRREAVAAARAQGFPA